MGPRHKPLLILACLALLPTMKANETSIDQNNCSFSSKKQILTCENIHIKDANIENLLTNTTQVLLITNSSDIHITIEQHAPTAYMSLSSYQILSNLNLEIDAFAFKKLNKLKYLKIIDNHYDTIKNNTFYGLDDLEVLDLNNNRINNLEIDSFNRLINLETLELTHNNFKIIRPYAFQTMKKLKSLFLYHNSLETLETNCLGGLINLSVLDLTYNRLTQINTHMFNELKQLSHLYLSFNQIETIVGDFESDALIFLYLQNNRLKTVSDLMFNSLSNLADLDISHNKINDLNEFAFYNLTKLTNLNYKGNNLLEKVDLKFNGSDPFITS